MSILLSRYSIDTVLPALIQALNSLPNLHTLQITGVHRKMSTALKTAFDGHVFPQIRTVILPSEAHNILRCCPETRKVVCINGDDGSQLIGAIANACKKVDTLEGFSGAVNVMKRAPISILIFEGVVLTEIYRLGVPKAVPNLRSITFGTRNRWYYTTTPVSRHNPVCFHLKGALLTYDHVFLGISPAITKNEKHSPHHACLQPTHISRSVERPELHGYVEIGEGDSPKIAISRPQKDNYHFPFRLGLSDPIVS